MKRLHQEIKRNKCDMDSVLIVTEVNTILSVVLVPHY